MKFRVDWYMVCLSLKKSKFGLILAGGQENACLKSMKMTSKNSERNNYSAEWSTIPRTPVLKKKKMSISIPYL